MELLALKPFLGTRVKACELSYVAQNSAAEDLLQLDMYVWYYLFIFEFFINVVNIGYKEPVFMQIHGLELHTYSTRKILIVL